MIRRIHLHKTFPAHKAGWLIWNDGTQELYQPADR